jgi:hypothetical protein
LAAIKSYFLLQKNNILWEGWVVFCLWSMSGKSVVRVVDLTVKNLSK